jgi:hypothetical protein
VKKNYTKHSDEIKQQAIVIFATTQNLSETARALNLPKATVKTWIDKKEVKAQIEQIQTEKRQDFAEKATAIIDKGLELLDRRLSTALDKQQELEKMFDVVANDEDLTDKQKQSLISTIRTLELQKLGEITTAVGTLFDKRALARGESTSNTNLALSDADKLMLERIDKRLNGGK